MRAPKYLDGLSHGDLIANIVRVLEDATVEDWAAGVSWYKRAHKEGGRLGRALGYRGRKAYSVGAGILAALSPSKAWAPNVAAAWRLVEEGKAVLKAAPLIQSRANINKALRIAQGERPLDVLGGDKVRAFYACIVDPNNPYVACIDRHAAAVAYYRPLSDSDMGKALGGGRYDLVADAYRAVAAVYGLRAHEVQAITWVTWRRVKNGQVDAM